MSRDGWRHVGASLMVALLVLGAGCSGALGGSNGPGATTANGTDTTAGTAAGDNGTTAGQTGATTSGTGTTTDGGTEHDHGGETTTADDGVASGEMAVVVAGNEIPIEGSGSSSDAFWVDGHAEDVWHVNRENVTLETALSTLGVDATADTLTYAGTTYRDDAANTSVNVRVNGEPVAPAEYELSQGDEVWVTVETPDMDVDVPGDHIDHDNLHIHGEMTFRVKNETVDFSRETYQNPSHSNYFHFEGGDAQPWHAHSWSVTLGYGLDTLSGLDATASSVTYNGTTYRDSMGNVSVSVTVNGEPVAPSEYFLKDGDQVRIVVESE